MSLQATLKGASGHKTALLYAAGIGLILSDIIPTPADALYFSIERNLRNKWKDGKISPTSYWVGEGAAYYGLNPLYWAGVLALLVNLDGDYHKKLKVGLAVVGAGAVIGVLLKNIQKDKADLLNEAASKPPTK